MGLGGAFHPERVAEPLLRALDIIEVLDGSGDQVKFEAHLEEMRTSIVKALKHLGVNVTYGPADGD